MGNSRGPPDAREWHFRALGALASHSPRHGRSRLERPLLDAIKADPRASKPAELSTAAPKPGALRAPCPRAAGASQARFRSGPPSWRTARATAARASRAAARRLRGPAAQDKAHRAARWRADARRAGEHRVREPPARARPAFGPRALTWRTAHATAAHASRAANRRHQAEPHKGKSTELLVAAPKHAAL